jgi:hypothetical protein
MARHGISTLAAEEAVRSALWSRQAERYRA